jgi:hypothetical protein
MGIPRHEIPARVAGSRRLGEGQNPPGPGEPEVHRTLR